MVRPKRSARADGAATQARIIEAAGMLFAQNGYARTTSKAVAQSAGVDLASINYHFESRDGLHQAVLVEAHRRLVQRDDLLAIQRGTGSPIEKLEAVIDNVVVRIAASGSWSATVLARELLDPSPQLQILMETEIFPKISIILQILSDCTGIPIDTPELACCLLSIAAPCAMLLVVQADVSPIRKSINSLPAEAIARHLRLFAVGGLNAVSGSCRTGEHPHSRR